jgi:peptidoglycan/LPS O-acetylase OafA/YrhL
MCLKHHAIAITRQLNRGIALAILVGMFVKGYGGAIRSFLSHPIFTPLARLTYQAYLVHPIWYDILITVPSVYRW